MDCPYCGRLIKGWTGLQELQNFQKHLRTCKKYPDKYVVEETESKVLPVEVRPKRMIQTEPRKVYGKNKPVSMNDALEIRAKSGR